MITPILVLLILVTGFLGAYTLKFQRATLALGKKLVTGNQYLPTGFQDAITPKSQTMHNIIFYMLLVAIFIYGFIFYAWYLAIVFVIATFILTGILMSVLPKDGSDYYTRKIKQDLMKRRSYYKKVGDVARVKAMDGVLRRFNGLP